MNRFKKEIRKKGIRLESDYPWMPYYIKGNSPFDVGNICVECVSINAENATVTTVYNTLVTRVRMNRNGSFEEIWDD